MRSPAGCGATGSALDSLAELQRSNDDAGRLHEHPSLMPMMLVAADFQLSKPLQVVIAGEDVAVGGDDRGLAELAISARPAIARGN